MTTLADVNLHVIEDKDVNSSPDAALSNQLQLPGGMSSGGSRRSSINSTTSKKAHKWFLSKHHRQRLRSNESHESTGSQAAVKATRHQNRTVRGFVRRGRTMRKTMRRINHVEKADSMTGEQKLRMYVLREILDTENDYTQLLHYIVHVIRPALQKLAESSASPICTNSTVDQLLSNIRDLHQLHVDFSKSLRDTLNPYPYHTHCIGQIFIRHREKFTMYAKYCANFALAQKLSYEMQEDPSLSDMIEEWKRDAASKTRKFLHLEGFIISPVQRLCKYPLLLRELNKFTPDAHPDAPHVSRAVKMMEEVTKSVNESERKAITLQAIQDVETMCDTWERSGCMSKHGFMTKQGGRAKTWNIRWFTLTAYQLSYYSEPADRSPLGVLDLTSYIGLEETADHIDRPFAFGIKMPDRTYYMYTISEQERKEWLTVLKWKFRCIDRSRSQSHRPLETVIFASLSSFLRPKGLATDSFPPSSGHSHSHTTAGGAAKANGGPPSPPADETTFRSRAGNFFRSFRKRGSRDRKSRTAATTNNSAAPLPAGSGEA